VSKVRVRFAPSPTGYLHVGGLRTALFNYLFAAKMEGTAILRIEDTDQKRRVEGAIENLLNSLTKTGLDFSEGIHSGGNFGPYIQSERLDIYQKYVDKLLQAGNAYYCFCSEEELTQMREEQNQNKQHLGYDGRCRGLSAEVVQKRRTANDLAVVRMKIPQGRGDFIIDDLVRGAVNFSPEQIEDQIILKSDGMPTYHLANVVDDHLMQITHVIRGEEWLPSTPKHIQLYSFFGWEPPQFAHLPLLLNPDRSKLSKRQGDVATEDFLKRGILPECLLNYIALLGWNTEDDQEIFSIEELKTRFSLERVGKTGAIFDQEKLHWMNQQYIKALKLDDLLERLQPFLSQSARDTAPELLKKMVGVVQERMVLLSDIDEQLDFFFHEKSVLEDENLLKIIWTVEAQQIYIAFVTEVKNQSTLSAENFGQVMKKIQKTTGVKGKSLWVPLRVAITQMEQGPDLKIVVDILGKEKVLTRVSNLLR
jgi:glutamyl-tRNA synthetase